MLALFVLTEICDRLEAGQAACLKLGLERRLADVIRHLLPSTRHSAPTLFQQGGHPAPPRLLVPPAPAAPPPLRAVASMPARSAPAREGAEARSPGPVLLQPKASVPPLTPPAAAAAAAAAGEAPPTATTTASPGRRHDSSSSAARPTRSSASSGAPAAAAESRLPWCSCLCAFPEPPMSF